MGAYKIKPRRNELEIDHTKTTGNGRLRARNQHEMNNTQNWKNHRMD